LKLPPGSRLQPPDFGCAGAASQVPNPNPNPSPNLNLSQKKMIIVGATSVTTFAQSTWARPTGFSLILLDFDWFYDIFYFSFFCCQTRERLRWWVSADLITKKKTAKKAGAF